MAVSRIKREFKEVMRSEEVSEESVITKGNEMIQKQSKANFHCLRRARSYVFQGRPRADFEFHFWRVACKQTKTNGDLAQCLFQIVQCSIKIELINDSWTELRGEIAGPPDTPYEGGRFVLEIKVPETYPFNPPKVSTRRRSLIIYIFCYSFLSLRSASSHAFGIRTFRPSLAPFVWTY